MPCSLHCVMCYRKKTLELILKDIAFAKDKKDSLFLTSQQDRVSSGSDRRQETVGSETKTFYTHMKSGSQAVAFSVSVPQVLRLRSST